MYTYRLYCWYVNAMLNYGTCLYNAQSKMYITVHNVQNVEYIHIAYKHVQNGIKCQLGGNCDA